MALSRNPGLGGPERGEGEQRTVDGDDNIIELDGQIRVRVRA